MFYIETYGCKINQYETQAIREAWQKNCCQETDSPEKADVIIINSCAITSRAERDSRNALYRNRKKAPFAKIIMTGCAAKLFNDFVPRKDGNPARPDLIIPQPDKNKLMTGPVPADTFTDTSYAISTFRRSRAVVKIQDGCTHCCAYCIVPSIRGKPKSREPMAILQECERLIQKHHGELVLSGINLNQYHHESLDFWALLLWLDHALARDHAGVVRLRISSIDPAQLDDRAIAILAQCQLVCPHLHLSLQHLSQTILKRMRRTGYSLDSILENLDKLHEIWPIFGIGADIITGFPGETEKDLDFLLEGIKRIGLTYGHVFPFSRRPGTLAYGFPQQIPKKEKDARSRLARGVITITQKEFWQKLMSLEQFQIALEETRPDRIEGYNEYYAHCILTERAAQPNRLQPAKPLAILEHGLLAEPLI